MTAKVPYPRQLSANETLDTLTHWRSHVRNYFRRDDNLKDFFARTAVWDSSQNNYGFEGDTAAAKADSLEGLLDTIAGFMPGPYLTARLTKQTTSMTTVFEVIWDHYDVSPNPSTFLDFAELCLMKEERYIDLYHRMVYHCEQHLLVRGAQVAGVQVQANEVITHSHKNMIALNWLRALDHNLVNIVKLEKHKELKDGQQLYTMVSDISKNIDEWLKRHGQKPPTRSQESLQIEAQVRNLRFEGYDRAARGTNQGQSRGGYRGNGRGNSYGNGRDGNGRDGNGRDGNGRGYNGGNGRGFNNRSNNSRYPNRQFSNSNRFCPGCNYLAKELHLDVNFRHFPADCTRKQSVLRILRSEEQHLDEEDQGEDEQEYGDDEEQHVDGHQGEQGGKTQNEICNICNKPIDPNCDVCKKPLNEKSSMPLKDKPCLPNILNAVWKSKSPTLKMSLLGHHVTTVIDEGSEISAINFAIVDNLNIHISRTVEAAQTAGSLPLRIRGKTANDIIVCKDINGSKIEWNLGQCLIVDNLGCDILIGEPGKARNNISTIPMSQSIVTLDNMFNKIVLSYEDFNSEQLFQPFSEQKKYAYASNSKTTAVAKVTLTSVHTIYPNQSVYVEVPKQFRGQSEVLVEPAENKEFPGPGIRSIRHGMICLENSTNNIQRIEDDILFFTSVRGLPKILAHDNSRMKFRKIYDLGEKSMKQFEFPHIDLQGDPHMLEKVHIDPNNRLSVEYKASFTDILLSFNDIITEVPGRYNGYYGQVNCALNLTDNPPPSIKPRLPNYSEEKLNIIASIMDDMEKWGVLAKPETLGIVPTHVHPCILVPKEGGKFRLVTDFRSIQAYIKPLPTVMPTVSDAMTALSSADFHIELDFSNYYWQNSIPIQDSEKLAVCHPFGGLRVYTVSPQGLRNSAEWGSEILARMYGDLVKEKKCTRIADQIYVLGNSLTELIVNFKIVHKEQEKPI